jgi:hypothetical protein
MGGLPACRWGRELEIPLRSKVPCYEMLHRVSELTGSCEHGNKSSVSIEAEEFLD